MSTDPTTIRLSDSFLLSDFLGSHSIYQKGLANPAPEPDDPKFKEAQNLAEYLEMLQAVYGWVSISYGYISPEVSRATITYQSPDKPSYHRWDWGAACDAIFHDHVQDEEHSAPAQLVNRIMHLQPFYSRMISYAESPYICIGTRVEENESAKGFRLATYENRYSGPKNKPVFIRCRKVRPSTVEKISAWKGEKWKGRGWPTYHGSGVLGVHHVRTSKYTMASDFFYNKKAVHLGQKTLPPCFPKSLKLITNQYGTYWPKLYQTLTKFGAIVDGVSAAVGCRVSIVQAVPTVARLPAWLSNPSIAIVPSQSVGAEPVMDFLSGCPKVYAQIRKVKNCNRVVIKL